MVKFIVVEKVIVVYSFPLYIWGTKMKVSYKDRRRHMQWWGLPPNNFGQISARKQIPFNQKCIISMQVHMDRILMHVLVCSQWLLEILGDIMKWREINVLLIKKKQWFGSTEQEKIIRSFFTCCSHARHTYLLVNMYITWFNAQLKNNSIIKKVVYTFADIFCDDKK